MPETTFRRRSQSGARSAGVGYAAGLAALWLILAVISPGTTYHLAPLLVAATPPVAEVTKNPGESASPGRATAVGGGLALLVALLLWIAGALEGPSLLPLGGAVLESVVFAVAGAIGGWLAALIITRRVDE